ncbi:hypothetical protein K469DRAFT_705902 [Zopfia rhizophila CBS 207.26]|uniref:Uncharacterized protein n=1 Tax=Zopfia rhizophila CBS 207.26 TaxID=1314779 RepID=A0A6A6EUH9_9PEZI|nr:hypothetical protein K469DRAFT_705902 [Zopfia rhizophila CBS 207.26]
MAIDQNLVDARQSGKVVELQRERITYSYTDTNFWIDGHKWENPYNIENRIKGRYHGATKDWLRAQMLFWGLTSPDSPIKLGTAKKEEMASRLLRKVMAGGILEIHPREICDQLKQEWKDKFGEEFEDEEEENPKFKRIVSGRELKEGIYRPRVVNGEVDGFERVDDDDEGDQGTSNAFSTTQNVGRNRKRNGDQAGLTSRQSSESKKSKTGRSVIVNQDLGRSSRIIAIPASDNDEDKASETGRAIANPEAESTDDELVLEYTAGPSASWRALMKQHQDLAGKHSFLQTAGSYILRCPEIEKRWPEFADKLTLDIKFVPSTGMTPMRDTVDAAFDFGIFKGSMVMAFDIKALVKYCWTKNRLSQPAKLSDRPTGNRAKEIMRLRELVDVVDNQEQLERQVLRLQHQKLENKSKEGSANAQNLHMEFEFRCREERERFMEEGTVFGHTGSLDFTSEGYLTFKGRINLPMVSENPITFEGFKTSNGPQRYSKPWHEYPLASVKFGEDWQGHESFGGMALKGFPREVHPGKFATSQKAKNLRLSR